MTPPWHWVVFKLIVSLWKSKEDSSPFESDVFPDILQNETNLYEHISILDGSDKRHVVFHGWTSDEFALVDKPVFAELEPVAGPEVYSRYSGW